MALTMTGTLPSYCMDWSCPAAVSCARHFGRSREYWAMLGDVIRRDGPRDDGAESCDEYEFDRARPWLMEAPRQ